MAARPRAGFSLAAFVIAVTAIAVSVASLWWPPAVALGIILAMIAVAMVSVTQYRIEKQMARYGRPGGR